MKVETASGDIIDVEAIRRQSSQNKNKELGTVFCSDPAIASVKYKAFCGTLRRSFGYGTQEHYVTVYASPGTSFELCPVCGKTQDMCGFRVERIS